MERGVGVARLARAAVLGAAIATLAAGCSLPWSARSDETPQSPTPKAPGTHPRIDLQARDEWTGPQGIGFTLELPDQWRDLTSEHLELVPDTVMAAMWSLGDSVNSEAGFATVSATTIGMDELPRYEVYEDLDGFASDMTDVSLTEDGMYLAEGGATGWYGTMTGLRDGKQVQITSAHIAHFTSEFMILIETYAGEEDDARALLDSLRTLTFVTPEPVEGRHGAPETENGRWFGYCRTVSMQASTELAYDFDPFYDSSPWMCPESTDYIGGFVHWADGDELSLQVRYVLDTTVETERAESSLPTALGETLTTDAGNELTLLWEEPVMMPDGRQGTMHGVDTLFADGDSRYRVGYLLPVGDGVIQVVVSSDWGSTGFRTDWLTPMLTSIQAEA